MNTKATGGLRGAAAAVTGSRHRRADRNGQDAAAVWVGDENHATVFDSNADRAGGVDVGAIVVCDGCGSGESSEVGARLGAQLALRAISRWLSGAKSVDGVDGATFCTDPRTTTFWTQVRAEVVRALDAIVRSMTADVAGAREQIVHDYFLFTTIAAVIVGDAIVVWAIGDGAYAVDGRVRELGPFENNQPPYLAYDLVDNPQVAHVEVTTGTSVIVATDGVAEVGLDRFAGVDRFVTHPDALRRHLVLLARGTERIEWDARRVVKTPALLQDDGAVAMLVRESPRGAS